MNSNRMEQITVYTDIKCPMYLEVIKEYATRLCPSKTNIVSLTASPDDPTPFLKYWVNEAPRELTNLSTSTTFMNDFECFITGNQDIRSGEVIYALYQRQMPVLALLIDADREANQKTPLLSTDNIPTMYTSHIQEILYHSRYPTDYHSETPLDSVENTIESFFRFPPQFGRMIAIESELPSIFNSFSSGKAMEDSYSPSTRLQNTQLLSSVIANVAFSYIREELGHSGDAVDSIKLTGIWEEISKNNPDFCGLDRMEKVVVLRSDGYPLSGLPPRTTAFMPSPLPAFHHLKDCFQYPLSNTMGFHGEKKDFATEMRALSNFLEQNPHLYSSLWIFERYGNRRMMRYLLQRGYILIILDHMSSAFHTIHKCLKFSEKGESEGPLRATSDGKVLNGKPQKNARELREKFDKLSSTLIKFEEHWIEMPMPSAVVFLSCGTDNSRYRVRLNGDDISSDCWILSALDSYYNGHIDELEKCVKCDLIETRLFWKGLVNPRELELVKSLREYILECIKHYIR